MKMLSCEPDRPIVEPNYFRYLNETEELFNALQQLVSAQYAFTDHLD